MALTKILQEGIKDGEIVNADINASAAIATSKISGLATSATTDTTNASNIASGTLPDGRFPATLPAISGANLTGINTDLVADSSPQLGGDLASNGNNILMADTDEIRLGTGGDLQLFHDATNSNIYNASGNLRIRAANNLQLETHDGEMQIKCIEDGAVQLYHDNVIRLTTDANGVVVTGNLYQVDNDKLMLGNSSDLEIFHDGSNSYIKDTGTGSLLIRGSTVSIQSTSGEAMIEGVADGAVTIKHDNAKKFETTSTGIEVSSTADSRIGITAGNTISQAGINFADSSAVDGVITYDHNTRKLQLGAGTSSFTDGDITIDSNGSVVFGDSTATASDGQQVEIRRADNTVYSASANRSNGLNIYNASGADGGYSGIILGSTSSSGHYGSTQLKNVSVGNGYSSDFVVQTRHGGTYGEKLRVRSDGGICFNGDTAAVNALDDYEEGSFTPTIYGVSSISYGEQYGRYVKIGKLVTVNIRIQFSGNTQSGYTFRVQGLPFQSASGNGDVYGSGGITYCSTPLSSTDYDPYIGQSSTEVKFYIKNTGGNITLASSATNSYMGLAAFYYV